MTFTLSLAGVAVAQRGDVVLVSRAAATAADSDSSATSVSADGRHVAFLSQANNLSGQDDDTKDNLFVRDLRTGALTLAGRSSAGVASDANVEAPALSGDGTHVVFQSFADTLSPDDDNTYRNVFLRDTAAGTTIPVSLNSQGFNAAGNSGFPSVSADGRYVAFESWADNLSPDDDNAYLNVFVRDTALGRTFPVSLNSQGFSATGTSFDASVSADGGRVAFASGGKNLSTLDDDTVLDVYVRDVNAGTTDLVSVNAFGVGGNGESWGPVISADGHSVAFVSEATNLAPADGDLALDVYVHDLDSGVTELVSQTPQGSGITGTADGPSVSADGRFVAYGSRADDVSPDDDDTLPNLFVRDRTLGRTAYVAPGVTARLEDDGPGDEFRTLFAPRLSADGRFLAFGSRAPGLSTLDDDSLEDVFRADVRGDPPACTAVARTTTGPVAVPLTCTDGDGDALTLAVASGPAHGTLGAVDQGAGTVTYTPAAGYAGPDAFSFTAADATGTSSPATAALTVTAVAGRPPSAPAKARGFGRDPLVALSLVRRRIKRRAPVRVRVTNANPFRITGTLRAKRARARAFRVAAAGAVTVRLKPTKRLRHRLGRRGRLALRVRASVTDPMDARRRIAKRLVVRLKHRR